MAPCRRQKRRLARQAMKAKKQNRYRPTDENFTKFPLLPPELRAAIWLFAILSPKVITAMTDVVERPILQVSYNRNYSIYLSGVKKRLHLILTCKESYQVALAKLGNSIYAGAVDTRTDIMYISTKMYRIMSLPSLILLDRPSESKPPRQMHFANMHQIAVEFDWCQSIYSSRHDKFIATLLKSGNMTHLFVVINQQRLCQWALNHAWKFAEDLRHSALHPHTIGLVRAPLEIKITILVKRWKYDAPQVGAPVDFDMFLSKFTAVQFKPGYRIKLDRHRIPRLLEPDPSIVKDRRYSPWTIF